MYSCGPLHMDEQRKDNKLEPTYSSSVPIRDVILKTCRKQWTIRKGRREGQGYLCWWHDMMMMTYYYNRWYVVDFGIPSNTLFEGIPKVPFSLAISPKCSGGRYSFPWIAQLTLDLHLDLNVKQGGIKYHFYESLVWLDLGLNAGLPGHKQTL